MFTTMLGTSVIHVVGRCAVYKVYISKVNPPYNNVRLLLYVTGTDTVRVQWRSSIRYSVILIRYM